MWYEDLRPFGATETDIFHYVEGVCSGQKSVNSEQWVEEGYPFPFLFRALYLSGVDREKSLIEDVESAVTSAPNSALCRLIAGYISALFEREDRAREHLGSIDLRLTPEARIPVESIRGTLESGCEEGDLGGDALYEDLLLKLARSAGLVLPGYRIDRRNRGAELQFLFRLAKFRGDLQGAVEIGKRLASLNEENSTVSQEVEFLEREMAFVRARKLREDADRLKNSMQERAANLRDTDGALDRETLEESFRALLGDLSPFMEGEAEDGAFHRTYAVVRAEIASSARNWSLLLEIAEQSRALWPDEKIWGEYVRNAEIQKKSSLQDRAIDLGIKDSSEDREDLDQKFQTLIAELAPFLVDEPQNGEFHRTSTVLRAALASSLGDWEGFAKIAENAQSIWPDQELWNEYARTAQIQLKQSLHERADELQSSDGVAEEEGLEASYTSLLADLQPFLDKEDEQGEIHRTHAVVRAELASSRNDWAELSRIAGQSLELWPEQALWSEYQRTADIQVLFEAYQRFEAAGDDGNAWNTLEKLLGIDPENPDFTGRAQKFKHVIPGGREKEIRALFAPYVAGKAMGKGAFLNIEVGECWIKAHIRQADGSRAHIMLEHSSQEVVGVGTVLPSFYMRLRGRGAPGRELRALARAVARNAPQEFPWVAASFSDMESELVLDAE